jgi:hypothetical protein
MNGVLPMTSSRVPGTRAVPSGYANHGLSSLDFTVRHLRALSSIPERPVDNLALWLAWYREPVNLLSN